MKTRLLQRVLWVSLTGGWLCVVHADESVSIQLEGMNLVGLPEKYAPAEFDMNTFRLRIGRKEMTLHPFLAAFFYDPHDLRITAPRYRYPDFPAWLRFHIEPKKRDFSYDLFFNMDTLEVLGIKILLPTDTGKRQLAIVPPDEVKTEITKSIRTFK